MFKNRRILIIDDDLGIRETYRAILSSHRDNKLQKKGASLFKKNSLEEKPKPVESMKYDLTLTENGDEGIKAVEISLKEDRPFVAAFVDMMMPGINGAETSKRIWEIDPEIKIVIVTAYSEYSPEDIIQITGRDDMYYLRKPFNQQEIMQFARALSNSWNLEMGKKRLAGKLEKANEALVNLNKNLQKKVKEQTAQLVQAEKMSSIGILASGIAHEINNPISYINSNLSAIKKYSVKIVALFKKYKQLETMPGKTSPEHILQLMSEISAFKEKQKIDFIVKDMVDLAEESLAGTKRIADIVKDMKTFSRLEDADHKKISINEALDTALNIVQNELKYKAQVIKDYHELPNVKCYPIKISQVFMNILLNAAQAMHEKGTIKIKTRHMSTGMKNPGEHVEISISDSGVGIPDHIISNIFDPFFTTKPVGKGTGLGLSIVYDIITGHEGTIKVKSKPATGTTFTIQIPVEAKHYG